MQGPTTVRTLRDLVTRTARPEGETDSQLLSKLQPFTQLDYPDQIGILRLAIGQGDRAKQQNIDAMILEQQRLGAAIAQLRQAMTNLNAPSFIQTYGGQAEDQIELRLGKVNTEVLQRMRLDEDTAALNAKQ